MKSILTAAAVLAALSTAPAHAGSAGLDGLRQSVGNISKMVTGWFNVPSSPGLTDRAREQSYRVFTSRPLARPNYPKITNSDLSMMTPANQDRYLGKVAAYERYRKGWLKQRARDYAQWKANPRQAPFLLYTTVGDRIYVTHVNSSGSGHTTSDGACYGVGCN